jgi:hypothetical protein
LIFRFFVFKKSKSTKIILRANYRLNSANNLILNERIFTGCVKHIPKKEIPANRFNDAGFICIFMPKKLLSFFVCFAAIQSGDLYSTLQRCVE